MFATKVSAQQTLRVYGKVYDYFSRKPLDGVTIRSTAGTYAISDSTGSYNIVVRYTDSIWFSYLTKNTQKYPVDTISNPMSFEIALYVDAAWLPEVKVRSRDYTQDSIQNRRDYAKYFNFRKPTGLKLASSQTPTPVPGSVTVGLDLDEIINVFRFKRTRQLASLQERLIMQEQDKYIDHRFTPYLVQKVTNLGGNDLDSFMVAARPSYEMLQTMNDIELSYYIEQMYKMFAFRKQRKSTYIWDDN
jgi:hypothetical protein